MCHSCLVYVVLGIKPRTSPLLEALCQLIYILFKGKKKYLKGDLFYLMYTEVRGELGQVALLYISFYAPTSTVDCDQVIDASVA